VHSKGYTAPSNPYQPFNRSLFIIHYLLFITVLGREGGVKMFEATANLTSQNSHKSGCLGRLGRLKQAFQKSLLAFKKIIR
jgi:hypothetical protein